MNEDLFRIDMSRVFRFIGKYKYLLIILPLAAAAVVFLTTLTIKPLYRFTARFVPGYFTTQTAGGREQFLNEPAELAREINAGRYRNISDQELEPKDGGRGMRADLITRRIIELTLESGEGTKGEEILRATLTQIMNDDKKYSEGSLLLDQEMEEELALLNKYEEELRTLRDVFQARAGLDTGTLNRDSLGNRPVKDLAMLSEVYMQIIRVGMLLQAMELRIGRLSQQFVSPTQIHEMEIIQPPKRTPQPVYPQTGVWVIIAFFLSLVCAVLLALLVDSYLKYRAERSNA